jgi:hypothetical protein
MYYVSRKLNNIWAWSTISGHAVADAHVPGSICLFGLAIAGMTGLRRRKA